LRAGAAPPARSQSGLLGPVAVGVGDYFHQVTVRVVEIDAATAVEMIDLAELTCRAPVDGEVEPGRRLDRFSAG